MWWQDHQDVRADTRGISRELDLAAGPPLSIGGDDQRTTAGLLDDDAEEIGHFVICDQRMETVAVGEQHRPAACGEAVLDAGADAVPIQRTVALERRMDSCDGTGHRLADPGPVDGRTWGRRHAATVDGSGMPAASQSSMNSSRVSNVLARPGMPATIRSKPRSRKPARSSGRGGSGI